jgi:hypothetical protein
MLAGAGTAVIEAGLFALAVAAGASSARIVPHEAPPPEPMPISVRPVLDDAPLLKLGGKPVKTKLPDMWRKQAPVQRFEEKSAPSPKAAKTPDAIPTTPLAKPDAGPPPPPDAAVAKQVDQVLTDAAAPTPTATGEGSPDGVKEGTETDPLKARAISQYQIKIRAWFNARFKSPTKDEIPCEELTKLRARFMVNIGGERAVAGFTQLKPSGNAVFDTRAQSTMQGAVGAELPPPPPLYPDILGSSLPITFAGSDDQCK